MKMAEFYDINVYRDMAELKSAVSELQKAGARFTGSAMDAAGERALVDEKIAAAEARSETKLTRVEAKLDLVIAKLDAVNNSYLSLKSNIWAGVGVVVAVVGIIVAILITLAPSAFTIGAQVRDIAHDEANKALSATKNAK